MRPNWHKWNVGDKVLGDVLVFVVRNGGEGRPFSDDFAFPVLIAGCFNASGTERGWECRLGKTKRTSSLVGSYTRLNENAAYDRREIPLFDPKHDILYYTEDAFLDVPGIDDGHRVCIPFEEILYARNAPNIFEGGVMNK